MTSEMLQLLAPVILIPILIWIGARYLPLLAGAGRARVYLLVFLCGGAVAAQIGMIRTQAYPFTAWTMYGQATVDLHTWRFVAVGSSGERDFPWKEAAPISAMRGFQRNFTDLAAAAGSGPDEVENARSADELDRLLGALMAIRNARRPDDPVHQIRVERCVVDPRTPVVRDEVPCETFLTVEAPAGRGSADAP